MQRRVETRPRSRWIAYSWSLLILWVWLVGAAPLRAQLPASADPAPLIVILWELERGDTAAAEQLIGENLPVMKSRLEGVLREIDQDFDELGRFGAVSYHFGPGYEALVVRNRRYRKLFELYQRQSGDEALFKRFEARRLRIEGADYTNRGERVCGEKLDWDQAEPLYRLAVERLETAFALAQEISDLRIMASTKNNLGSTLIRLGRPTEAIRAYSEGMRYADQMPRDLYKGLVRLNLGNTYVWIGKPEESLAYSQGAVAIFRKMGRGTWEANALLIVGNAYLRQKQFANAWETLSLSLERAKQSREDRVRGQALLNLGMAGLQLKKRESASLLVEALEWHEQQAEVYVPIVREAVQQDGLRLLSRVAEQEGDVALAEKYTKQFRESIGPDPDRYGALRKSPCFAIYLARPITEEAALK